MKRFLFAGASVVLIAAMSASAQRSNVTPPQKPVAMVSADKPNQRQREARRADAIEGRVVGDDGQPLIKIQVYASAIGRLGGFSRTAGADDEGKFQVEDLAPRAYSVSARVPGYVVSSESAGPRYYRSGDFVNITMMKGSVITGTVTDSSGKPVVAMYVNVIRVRDTEGRPVRNPAPSIARQTDDRGVYRLYGLLPGSYLVVAGAPGSSAPRITEWYAEEAPTYFPSATRDTAAEVIVDKGQEATGIDIRYLGELGHAISGRDFTSGEGSLSPPVRVRVRGTDLTGIEVKLAPLGSIAGRVSYEPQPGASRNTDCKDERAALLEEMIVIARLDEKRERKDQARQPPGFTISAINDRGEFALQQLHVERYHIEAQLPSKNWYIRAITSPSSARGNRTVDAARNGIALKSGERVEGLSINIAEGAASLTGQVVHSVEGSRLPDRLRVHLVPADKDRTDDTLRFAEVAVKTDGSFAMVHLAPGRYRMVVRQASDEEASGTFQRPMAWDAEGRETLRRMAEASDAIIELQSCRQMSHHRLVYTPGPSTDGRSSKKKR